MMIVMLVFIMVMMRRWRIHGDNENGGGFEDVDGDDGIAGMLVMMMIVIVFLITLIR